MDDEVYFLLQPANRLFVVAAQSHCVSEACVEHKLVHLGVEVVLVNQVLIWKLVVIT